MKRAAFFIIVVFLSFFGSIQAVFPHCDTMDGPVIGDAKKAFETGNVNYVLKWVKQDDENVIKKTFTQAVKVRALNADAKDLAEKYFFDVLVRIHRAGEGVPFTGVKPSGIPIDEKISAADKSIQEGNLAPLAAITPEKRMSEMKELFKKVIALQKFDVNNVEAGRKYIEAYVQFFHFAEGEEGHGHGHGNHAEDFILFMAVIAAITFFITTVFFSYLYLRIRKTKE